MTPPFLPADYPEPAIPLRAITAPEWPLLAEREPMLAATAAVSDFRAQSGRVLHLSDAEGSLALAIVGLGERPNPVLAGALGKDLPPGVYAFERFGGADPTLTAIGFGLGAYAFDRYKARRRPAPRLILRPEIDARHAAAVVEASYLVRDLVNTPAADMGPEAMHAVAAAEATRAGAQFEAIVGDALLAKGFPLIHAVGRAAAEPPRLLRLRWGDAGAPKIAIVGKGVTFDTGGLDLKPSAGMRIMKKDMGGAAHALGLARLIVGAGLAVSLDVWLPVVENSVGPSAFRPGDVLQSRKGLTIEIDNTDAEGRLILADALARACEERPELVLDFATLTGAARTALGPDVPPFFTDDETLAADLAAAAAATHDALWRLPLFDGYDADLDSPIADLVNSPSNGFAGAVIAALFLRRFVKAPAWAHFDVYAWSPKDRPGRPQGGEAQGLRAAFEMLRRRYG